MTCLAGDPDAQTWREALGYDHQKFISVHASKPHRHKADIIPLIDSERRRKSLEGISIELVGNFDDLNQIDKRWLQQYAENGVTAGRCAYSARAFFRRNPH